MSSQPGWGDRPQWGAPPAPSGWGAPPPPAAPSGWGAPPPPGPPGGWGGPPAGPGGPGGPWLPQPRPGIVPLRPLTVGEILDGAFQAIRTNPAVLIGVSALVVAASTVVSALPSAALLTDLGTNSFVTGAQPDPADLGPLVTGTLRAQLPAYLIQLLSTALLTALLTVAVSNAVLGVRTPARALWQRVRPRLGAVLALAVVQTLLLLAAAGVWLLPGALLLRSDPLTGGLLVLLGLLPAALVSLYLLATLGLSGPALVLEGRGPVAALARSWRLVRGSFWRVLGTQLLATVIRLIGAALVAGPFALLVGAVLPTGYDDFGTNLLRLLAAGLGGVVGGAVFYPFTAAVTTLLYVDLRMRREGLDVDLARHVAGGPA